jgi:hypothetical protein
MPLNWVWAQEIPRWRCSACHPLLNRNATMVIKEKRSPEISLKTFRSTMRAPSSCKKRHCDRVNDQRGSARKGIEMGLIWGYLWLEAKWRMLHRPQVNVNKVVGHNHLVSSHFIDALQMEYDCKIMKGQDPNEDNEPYPVGAIRQPGCHYLWTHRNLIMHLLFSSVRHVLWSTRLKSLRLTFEQLSQTILK